MRVVTTIALVAFSSIYSSAATADVAAHCDVAADTAEGTSLLHLAQQEKMNGQSNAREHFTRACDLLLQAYQCTPGTKLFQLIAMAHMGAGETMLAKADLINAQLAADRDGDALMRNKIGVTLSVLDQLYGNIIFDVPEYAAGARITIDDVDVPENVLHQKIPLDDGQHLVRAAKGDGRFAQVVLVLPDSRTEPMLVHIALTPPLPAGSACIHAEQCRSETCFKAPVDERFGSGTCTTRAANPWWGDLGGAGVALGGLAWLSGTGILIYYGVAKLFNDQRPDLVVPGWTTFGVGLGVFTAGIITVGFARERRTDQPPPKKRVTPQ